MEFNINNVPELYNAVYKITSPSGKVYIGSTVNLTERMRFYRNNYKSSQYLIYRSIKKYGVENHKFEVMEYNIPIDELRTKELMYGVKFDTLNNKVGLNLSLPKKGEVGGHSDETKQKISEARKEFVKNNGCPNIGTKQSSEHIQRRISNRIKTIQSPDYIKPSNKPRKKCSRSKPRKIILDMETGIYYEGLLEVCELTGLSKSYLSQMLSGTHYNTTNLKYI